MDRHDKLGYHVQVSNMRFNPDPVVSQQVEHAESIWYGDELTEVLISVSACAVSYFTRRNLYPGQEIIHTTPAGDLLIISRVDDNWLFYFHQLIKKLSVC